MTRRISPPAVAVLTVIVLISGVVTAIRRQGGERDRVAGAAMVAVEYRVERFVEAARGLSFTRPVAVHLATAADFRRLLHGTQRADTEQIAGATATLIALGLVPPDVDLRGEIAALLDAAVVGFYDPHTRRLYVRGGQPTPFVQVTMAHELTHALQDQHFDLRRFDKLQDEPATAATALIEGDAVRIEQTYYGALSPANKSAYQAEAAQFGSTSNAVPAVLENLLVFPYIAGPKFVAALTDRGGNSVVDGAFRAPPTTTEQILHPDKYFDREPEVKVDAPKPHGTVVDRGELGEYGLQLVLGGALDPAEVNTAAAGWGGDRYVTWRTGSGPRRRDHFAATIAMDTERDAIELAAAFDGWSRNHRTAHATRDRDIIVLTVDGPPRGS